MILEATVLKSVNINIKKPFVAAKSLQPSCLTDLK